MSERNALIKLGIVGCGEHSHEHFKAAIEVQGIKITTCCDIQDVRARACAERYGCDKYYTSLEKMLEEEKLDGIILCT